MTTSKVTSHGGLPSTESLRAEIVRKFDGKCPELAQLSPEEKLHKALYLRQEGIFDGVDVATIYSLYSEIHEDAVLAKAILQVHGKYHILNDRCAAKLKFLRSIIKRRFNVNYRRAEGLREDINFSPENFAILCLDYHNRLNQHQPLSIVRWRKRDGYAIGHDFDPKKANTGRFVFPENVYEEIRKLGTKEARDQLRAIKAMEALKLL